jgi:hypothetical protein
VIFWVCGTMLGRVRYCDFLGVWHQFGQWHTQDFVLGEGGSINSVEDRGQRERGSGSGSPLVRCSVQFENE